MFKFRTRIIGTIIVSKMLSIFEHMQGHIGNSLSQTYL